MTRLQARISSMGRAAERQNLHVHTVSLPALHTFTDLPELSFSGSPSPPSSKRLQNTVPSPSAAPPAPLRSPTIKQPCLSPPATSAFHLPDSLPTSGWLQSSSINSSTDLPPSPKATLRAALTKHPWEYSSASISTFPETSDHSWRGLNASEASAESDGSFNPLTYMVDKADNTNISMEAQDEQHSESRRESVSTLVGQEEEVEDMSSLTGMLKFVNQTLALQEDPSAWSSTKQIQS